MRQFDHADHCDYYTARAKCARRLEQKAASPMIAAIHAEMAGRYERLSLGLGSDHIIADGRIIADGDRQIAA